MMIMWCSLYRPNYKPKTKWITNHNLGEKMPKTAERIFLEGVRKRRNESRRAVKRRASSCIVPVAAATKKTKKNQQVSEISQ